MNAPSFLCYNLFGLCPALLLWESGLAWSRRNGRPMPWLLRCLVILIVMLFLCMYLLPNHTLIIGREVNGTAEDGHQPTPTRYEHALFRLQCIIVRLSLSLPLTLPFPSTLLLPILEPNIKQCASNSAISSQQTSTSQKINHTITQAIVIFWSSMGWWLCCSCLRKHIMCWGIDIGIISGMLWVLRSVFPLSV